jgi:hypothetical protein
MPFRFADLATVSGQEEAHPYNIHTEADKRRRKYMFHRSSTGYKPKTWASPEGCEKEETSWYRKGTVVVDGVLKVQLPFMSLAQYRAHSRLA